MLSKNNNGPGYAEPIERHCQNGNLQLTSIVKRRCIDILSRKDIMMLCVCFLILFVLLGNDNDGYHRCFTSYQVTMVGFFF